MILLMPFFKRARNNWKTMRLLVKRLVNQPRMFLACLKQHPYSWRFQPIWKRLVDMGIFPKLGWKYPHSPQTNKCSKHHSQKTPNIFCILDSGEVLGGVPGTSGRIITFHLSTCCAFETGIYQALQGRNLRTNTDISKGCGKNSRRTPHTQWPHLLSRKYIF